MYPELLINYGPNTLKWLSEFSSDVLQSEKLPLEFKRSKLIAILKPKKAANQPEN